MFRTSVRMEGSIGFVSDNETFNNEKEAREHAKQIALEGLWSGGRCKGEVALFVPPQYIRYALVIDLEVEEQEESPITEVKRKSLLWWRNK